MSGVSIYNPLRVIIARNQLCLKKIKRIEPKKNNALIFNSLKVSNNSSTSAI